MIFNLPDISTEFSTACKPLENPKLAKNIDAGYEHENHLARRYFCRSVQGLLLCKQMYKIGHELLFHCGKKLVCTFERFI